MAKKVNKLIKLMIPAGQATPAPPLGPVLSQAGINIKDFCDQFNDKTKDGKGILTPVVVSIYEDRTFTFTLKTPPVSELIRRSLNIKKGSATPNVKKVGKLSNQQLEEIAKQKMEALNTNDMEKAKEIIKGTARQMGIETD